MLLTVIAAGAGLSNDTSPLPAQPATGAAAAILAAVLVVLAAAMWPRRGATGGPTGGVAYYAHHNVNQLAADLAATGPDHWQAERAITKSRIAVRKHRCQRVAGAGLAAAGVLLALATVTALI